MCAGVIYQDIPLNLYLYLYLYLYLNSIFTNMRPVWVCGGVISLDLPLHQPPTSESCLPVALDCREGHRRNQNTQMFSQLVERTFEWKNNEIEETAELDCLRDYQGLIKAQDGFIEPQFPIWLSLSISFPFWLWPILYSETFAFLDIIILPVTATNFQIVKVFPRILISQSQSCLSCWSQFSWPTAKCPQPMLKLSSE